MVENAVPAVEVPAFVYRHTAPYRIARHFICWLGSFGDVYSGRRSPRVVLGVAEFSILFAWPGYIVVLLLGFPTLYLADKYRWTSIWMFTLLGAVYAVLPWFVIAMQPVLKGRWRLDIALELLLFGLAGAISGVLVRTIFFGHAKRLRSTAD